MAVRSTADFLSGGTAPQQGRRICHKVLCDLGAVGWISWVDCPTRGRGPSEDLGVAGGAHSHPQSPLGVRGPPLGAMVTTWGIWRCGRALKEGLFCLSGMPSRVICQEDQKNEPMVPSRGSNLLNTPPEQRFRGTCWFRDLPTAPGISKGSG